MKTNIILLAGRGKRFADAGYTFPKPLISVDGMPMFVAASRDLPSADQVVFVVSDNYIRDYSIDRVIKEYFPRAEIMVQDVPLQGQAHSVLQAESVIDPDAVLTIGTCDSGAVYDLKKFEELLNDPSVDALIWSFRNYPPMATNPTAYGWIETDGAGFVTKVHYKKPISNDPLHDHAVVGHFTYKKAKYCFENVKDQIARNARSGPEFSLDECTNVLIANGLRVKVFEIDVFRCWGTPDELRTYEYWQDYFRKILPR